jgi:hypothetical protein
MAGPLPGDGRTATGGRPVLASGEYVLRVAVQLSGVKVALRVDTDFAVIVARGSVNMASGTNDRGKHAI